MPKHRKNPSEAAADIVFRHIMPALLHPPCNAVQTKRFAIQKDKHNRDEIAIFTRFGNGSRQTATR